MQSKVPPCCGRCPRGGVMIVRGTDATCRSACASQVDCCRTRCCVARWCVAKSMHQRVLVNELACCRGCPQRPAGGPQSHTRARKCRRGSCGQKFLERRRERTSNGRDSFILHCGRCHRRCLCATFYPRDSTGWKSVFAVTRTSVAPVSLQSPILQWNQ